jgi:glucose/arabinose dehydrogenase
MLTSSTLLAAAAAALLPQVAIAQGSSSSSSCGLQPSGNIRPSVASGYRYQVVATGLARPRGIHFDNDGHLLVVESQSGGRVVAMTLNEDDAGCVTASEPKVVTENMMVRSMGEAEVAC